MKCKIYLFIFIEIIFRKETQDLLASLILAKPTIPLTLFADPAINQLFGLKNQRYQARTV